MARLYADENFDHGVVRKLRNLGHDVLTAQQAGLAYRGVPDPDQLAFAINEGRAIITFNRGDFHRLHRRTSGHCGIITCTGDDDNQALALRIHHAILATPDLTNQLIRIYRPNTP